MSMHPPESADEHPRNRVKLCSNGDALSNSNRSLSDLEETLLGIKRVQDVDVAQMHVFKEPDLPLIVVCGWPRCVLWEGSDIAG